MYDLNPMFFIDGYKSDHRSQYPNGTEMVYSNFTPRSSRVKNVNGVVAFGFQYLVMEYIIDRFNRNFFERNKEIVLQEYQEFFDSYLYKGAINTNHIAELHDLGYLPIRIKAVKEGTIVPINIPVLTIRNTKKGCEWVSFWITNYFETLLSNILWKPMTSATISNEYRREFERHCEKTGYDSNFINWQGHDFSFRGMSGIEDAVMSGAGHLLSFTGTDTIPAIHFLKKYYGADYTKELVGGSVAATEHSVMCMCGKETEYNTFKRLITEVYPKGIVSIVSDTWDFWEVVTKIIPSLKNEILNRDGKVVVRPDSGDPVKIICGYKVQNYEDALGFLYSETEAIYEKNSKKYYKIEFDNKENIAIFGVWGWKLGGELSEAEVKGAYEVLYDIFGGKVNSKGYKELNGSIGLIYGDSITLDRQKQILKRLEDKGFAASNLVLGIGSYTYEYVTRDTFGFAMKATAGIVNGEFFEIYKDPKTDNGTKKSAKGLLKVYEENGKILLKEQCSETEENEGILEVVFEDGKLIRVHTLKEIRDRLFQYRNRNGTI